MIGIISDTHEQVKAIKKAVKILKKKKVEFVIHCGDIISPPMLELFKGLKMKIIFGNNDGEKTGLNSRAEKLGFEEITETKCFEHKGKKFWVVHGKDPDILVFAIRDQVYDYIITGHTHETYNRKKGITRIINPGSLLPETPTMAILDIRKDEVKFINIR